MRERWFIVTLFAAFLFAFLGHATAGTPIIEIDTHEPIYAVGDIHGDYARLVRLLQGAQVIDARNHWAAGKSVVVFTGDMIDKGPQPVEVLRLIQMLQEEASAAGGRVVALMGNHEAEFLGRPDPKKAADFLSDLRRNKLPPAAFNTWFASLPVGARVNDWFFCHGGNTAGKTIAQLNTEIAKKPATVLDPDSMLEARLSGSATWFAARDERDLLATYAHALSAEHIVQGHQHNEVKFSDGAERRTGEIFQQFGILFLIDVGMSEGVGDSQGALLRIQGSAADAVCPDGRVTRLWDAEGRQETGRTICK